MTDQSNGGRPEVLPKSEGEDSESRRTLLGAVLGRLSAVLRSWTGESARDSIEEILDQSEEEKDSLAPEERHMLRNILEFSDLRVEDVMVPRADIIGVEAGISLADLVRLFRDAQHSRLPLYRETLDNPLGMVHIKDVVSLLVPGEEPAVFEIEKLRRDILFVPASMPVVDLLLKMQTSHIHLALVVDEYGGIAGLLSIEDVVEQIVGDIEDEHDTDTEHGIAKRADGSFDVIARVELEDLEQVLGHRLAVGELEEEVDTIGGLAAALIGRVPRRGDVIELPSGAMLEITDADARRVKRVRIRPAAPAGSEEAAPAPATAAEERPRKAKVSG
ncbi:MAG: HlyC/CorC family transporter [Alphaproteobacteria bacterium]|nr:HlyC/CorC family transporter [Alphaproteobacteria bacterium]